MKILQVGLGNNPGGVEAFVLNYFRNLVQYGVKFDFVCMYPTIAHEAEIKKLGGNIFYVPNVKKNYLGYKKAFDKILKDNNYDVIHVNMLSAANIEPLKLAARHKVRVLVHAHNTDAPGLIRNIMHKLNYKKIEKYATKYAACSQEAAEWLFPGRKDVTIIQNAIDSTKYSFCEENRVNIRKKFGWENKLVIGHVGRFDIQKNQLFLIEVLENLVKKEKNLVLCMIGEGSLQEQIRTKIQEKNLEQYVEFLGVKNNVEDYLSAMDVFVFPSLFEGFPFTLIEAQMNGLPCVISDTITESIVLNSKQVKRISLKSEKLKWCEAIFDYSNWKRERVEYLEECLYKHKLDINEEGKTLLKMYQECE